MTSNVPTKYAQQAQTQIVGQTFVWAQAAWIVVVRQAVRQTTPVTLRHLPEMSVSLIAALAHLGKLVAKGSTHLVKQSHAQQMELNAT